jgi:hypothetical protein
MQYNYNLATDEFEENQSGKEEENVTGNRVFVSGTERRLVSKSRQMILQMLLLH